MCIYLTKTKYLKQDILCFVDDSDGTVMSVGSYSSQECLVGSQDGIPQEAVSVPLTAEQLIEAVKQYVEREENK